MLIPEKGVKIALRAQRRNRIFISSDAAQAHVAALKLRPLAYGPPAKLHSPVQIDATRRDGWPVYHVSPVTDDATGTVVYAHGGGWVNEIVSLHWELIAQIAAEARVNVVVPIYPLVPFGTAGEVAGEFVEIVREQAAAGPVCLAGDSAGGQIALSTALELRDRHAMTLPQTVLISPALDLSWSNPQIPEFQIDDPWLGVPGGQVLSELWRGELPVSDQRVSPLAGELSGLGPITMFSGTHDILHPDARLLVERAEAADVEIDFHPGPELVHVYPLLPTRSGQDARQVIVTKLGAALPG